ncbi:MAG: hypothetical protein WBP59_17325 [Ilumatobacteraceae bacterium]
MPPSPTLFDDNDELPAPPSTDAPDGDLGPNYLVRRALVVGGVVAVIAAAAVLVGQLISSGDETTSTGAAQADWNRIVLVEPRTGQVITLDDAGEEVSRINTGLRSPSDVTVVQSTAVLVSDSGTAVVALDAESTDDFELAADDILTPSGTTLTMMVSAGSGEHGLLVHGPTGDLIDTDEFAPITGARYDFSTARSDSAGRDVLVTDTGNFQSVLFSFDRSEPSFFPGLALAVDADTVVTAQNVGSDATVSLFDHDGAPLASGRTASVRAAMIDGDQVHLVTVDGQIITMSADTGDTEEGEQLTIGTIESGHVSTTGDRLIVTGSAGTAIIDADGTVVASVADMRPPDTAALLGSTCVALTDGSDADILLSIVDLTNGATLLEADVAADPSTRSADGCTLGVGDDDGYDLIGGEGVERVDGNVLVALAPDATATAVEQDGRLVLTTVDTDAEAEPVDLGTTGRTVFFTES